MQQYIVKIADMKVVQGTSGIIVTHALGSCIGVAIYDPRAKVGGILHYLLPESSLNKAKAQANPLTFGDTGIPLLFKEAYAKGANKRSIIVKLAGGAEILESKGNFNIGKRNYMIARKLFWKNGVLIRGEDVGGTISRSLSLDLATGKVVVKSPGMGEKVL